MATPNPRKFQEKIALLQQKEAEGQKAYDKIMSEVQELRLLVRVLQIIPLYHKTQHFTENIKFFPNKRVGNRNKLSDS